jgi:hypothetical protein
MAAVESKPAKAASRKKGGVGGKRSEHQKRGIKLRAAERGRFLKSLAAGNTASRAAEDTGRGLSTFYRHRDIDDSFAAAWLAAEKQGTQALEQVAIGRAKDQSDTLLMFLLKRRDPAYRDSARVEVTGANGGPLEVEHKVVTIGAVKHILEGSGALDDGRDDRSGRALAGARQVLPASTNGQASGLPDRPVS